MGPLPLLLEKSTTFRSLGSEERFRSRPLEPQPTGFWKKSGEHIWVFPKIVGFPSKSSILIEFSIIFTIHFGVSLFLETPTGIFGVPGYQHVVLEDLSAWYIPWSALIHGRSEIGHAYMLLCIMQAFSNFTRRGLNKRFGIQRVLEVRSIQDVWQGHTSRLARSCVCFLSS